MKLPRLLSISMLVRTMVGLLCLVIPVSVPVAGLLECLPWDCWRSAPSEKWKGTILLKVSRRLLFLLKSLAPAPEARVRACRSGPLVRQVGLLVLGQAPPAALYWFPRFARCRRQMRVPRACVVGCARLNWIIPSCLALPGAPAGQPRQPAFGGLVPGAPDRRR